LNDLEVAAGNRASWLDRLKMRKPREVQRTRGQGYGDETKEELQMSKTSFFREMWSNDEGQDIAEYAVMLAVILVIVVGTIRLIGGNANNVFSSVASSLGQ
jgi:Flp pilus assembly pilin Flp